MIKTDDYDKNDIFETKVWILEPFKKWSVELIKKQESKMNRAKNKNEGRKKRKETKIEKEKFRIMYVYLYISRELSPTF